MDLSDGISLTINYDYMDNMTRRISNCLILNYTYRTNKFCVDCQKEFALQL